MIRWNGSIGVSPCGIVIDLSTQLAFGVGQLKREPLRPILLRFFFLEEARLDALFLGVHRSDEIGHNGRIDTIRITDRRELHRNLKYKSPEESIGTYIQTCEWQSSFDYHK